MLESVLKRGKFSDPLLEPNPVANAVVAQILSGKSGQIFLPASYSAISALRGFPTWFQEMVRSSKRNVLAL